MAIPEVASPLDRSTGAEPAALVVNSVTKKFNGLTAVDNVSLTVERGKILGLTGPNGSGKSTLINVITGILKPSSGSILVGSKEITGLSSYAIAQTGIARSFQTVRLFKALTVRDNIAAALRDPEGPIDNLVDHIMEQVGMAHLSEAPAHSLAYGLQRRVEVARAIATRPRYILLDEPAAGLNDDEGMELEEMIRFLARDEEYQCGIIIIDHEMRLLTSLCDSLHVLANGKTLSAGTPSEVRNDPKVIKAYIGSDE